MAHEHERRTDLNQAEVKAAMKAAIKEWLDEKFSEFGRWSMGAMFAAALAALTIFILRMNGWQKH